MPPSGPARKLTATAAAARLALLCSLALGLLLVPACGNAAPEGPLVHRPRFAGPVSIESGTVGKGVSELPFTWDIHSCSGVFGEWTYVAYPTGPFLSIDGGRVNLKGGKGTLRIHGSLQPDRTTFTLVVDLVVAGTPGSPITA